MKEKILNLLKETHPRHRTRIISKNSELLIWFQKQYPNVKLNIAIDSLVKDYSPYCCICCSPIKHIGKSTCSVVCRSQQTKKIKHQIVKKRKATLLNRYGVDNPAKLSSVQDKRLKTMVDKYGRKISEKSLVAIKGRTDNLNQKGRETLIKKYGVSNPGQLKDHKEKCRKTTLKNYGVDHYTKSNLFLKSQKEKTLIAWQAIFPSTINLLTIEENSLKKQLFENPNKEIEFLCTICNKKETLPTETVKWRLRNTGTPCGHCSGMHTGSAKQKELMNFIQSLGISCVQNFKLDNNKQIDVMCVDQSIGFEFDGLFWHNDTRVHKRYHLDKTETAVKQNIRLIHIFEDEWDHKKDIVKSRIANLLRKTSIKLGARRCQIRSVNVKDEKEFLEKNHIQGYARSNFAFGLYYKDSLVSLMSFSKPSKSKGQIYKEGHWELLRFASCLNSNIIGAADRLLNYFIQIENPQQILSFADKRWSTGDLYRQLGFDRQKDTAINYWYINLKENKRIHRYKLRKNKQDNPQLTEYQNRLNQGYLRIWDCGSSKWIWSNKTPS